MKKILIFACILSLAASCTISYPGIATGNKAEKSGSIEKKVFMGIAIKPVDLSLESAAKKGKITKIATVDYSVTHGLFIVTYKVDVTGN